MNKLLMFVFVLLVGCEIAEMDIDVDNERLSKEERMDLLREKYPDYDYYLELHSDGVWELVEINDLSIEQGSVDWAERCLRNPENTHKVPDGAPYKFNINTGLSFIK